MRPHGQRPRQNLEKMTKNDVIEILAKYGIEVELDNLLVEKTIKRGNRTIDICIRGSVHSPNVDYNVSVHAYEPNWTVVDDLNYGREKVESYLYTAFNERFDVLNRFKKELVEFLNANPCERFYLQACPTDYTSKVDVDGDNVRAAHDAYRRMSPDYRDHVIGFKADNNGDVLPVLEGEWDKMFWGERDRYYADKMAWCAKHGCD